MDAPLQLPRLAGRGVVLRAFEDDDAALVQEASADPYLPLVTTVPATPDPGEARAFLRRQRARAVDGVGYSFAVEAGGTAVGQIGLWPGEHGRAGTGYWIAPHSRGRGFARAALAVLSPWALDLPGVHRLELQVEPWNLASVRTAEGAGFEREGLLRSWREVGGVRRDFWLYARLR